ncbi:uncharacterized protein LY79DRAFT_564137 [Colletotrichum navitas]|uniref:Uncharacterized protein n=1 Tax=Colletotrichum navitas TaxID=681940 RepID=A0AAD8PSH9_9PEZI|nr:uncharacterized protein LY79DRAFT_564137 [Colletotrichum navitas]KAK1579432.1 hypothetical protein LY79DRAFT_564137 [Colletotrichum navitas]
MVSTGTGTSPTHTQGVPASPERQARPRSSGFFWGVPPADNFDTQFTPQSVPPPGTNGKG